MTPGELTVTEAKLSQVSEALTSTEQRLAESKVNSTIMKNENLSWQLLV